MPNWTLSVGGVTKPISGWGIATDSFTVTKRSLQTGMCSFAMVGITVVGEPVFTERAEAILFLDGTRHFVGEIYEDGADLEAMSQVQRYVIKDRWDMLEHCAFKQARTVKNDAFTDYRLAYSNRVILSARVTSILLATKVEQKDAISDLLAFAVSEGVQIAYDVDFSGVLPPYQEAKGLTVAAAIRLIIGVLPDVMSWWDYTVTPYPKLYIRRRATITPTVIDLSDYSSTVGLVSVKPLKPLSDLYVDSVEATVEDSAVDPTTQNRFARLTPFLSGLKLPAGRNLRAEFGLGGQGSIAPEVLNAQALVDVYYAALHQLYFQTTLKFSHLSVPGTYRPGYVFNFTGTVSGVAVRAAWGTAGAIAQQVTEQPFRGITLIECGSPPGLSTATFKELQQKLAAMGTTSLAGSTSGITISGLAGVNPHPYGTISGHITGNSAGVVDKYGVIDDNGVGITVAGIDMTAVGLWPAARLVKKDGTIVNFAAGTSFPGTTIDYSTWASYTWYLTSNWVDAGYVGEIVWTAP